MFKADRPHVQYGQLQGTVAVTSQMADRDLNICSAVFPTQLGEANYQLESRLADSTRELQSKTLTAGVMGMRSEMLGLVQQHI